MFVEGCKNAQDQANSFQFKPRFDVKIYINPYVFRLVCTQYIIILWNPVTPLTPIDGSLTIRNTNICPNLLAMESVTSLCWFHLDESLLLQIIVAILLVFKCFVLYMKTESSAVSRSVHECTFVRYETFNSSFVFRNIQWHISELENICQVKNVLIAYHVL